MQLCIALRMLAASDGPIPCTCCTDVSSGEANSARTPTNLAATVGPTPAMFDCSSSSDIPFSRATHSPSATVSPGADDADGAVGADDADDADNADDADDGPDCFPDCFGISNLRQGNGF